MKNLVKGLLTLLCITVLTVSSGCARQKSVIKIKTLTVGFAPVSDVATVYSAGQPLGLLLKEKLVEQGYVVDDVKVLVGSSYDTVYEGLSNGNIDIALVPSGTYGQSDSVKYHPILVGLCDSVETDDITVKDIYAGSLPVYDDASLAEYVRTYFYVNTETSTGKELLEKAEKGTLTFDDLNKANWMVGNPAEEVAYIYPSAWMMKQFGKPLSSLQHLTTHSSDYDSITALLKGECDIITAQADLRSSTTAQTAFRIQYPSLADNGKTVGDVIKVLAVSGPVMNHVILASDNRLMTEEFIGCLQECFLSILKTGEGEKCLHVLGLKGFAPCTENDLQIVREVYGK